MKIKRLRILLLLPIVLFAFTACAKKPSNAATSNITVTPNTTVFVEVNTYIDGLKENAVADSFSSILDSARTTTDVSLEEASLNNLNITTPPGYTSCYQKIKAEIGLSDITTWGVNNNIVYPGNILKIADPKSSDMLTQVVGLERAPGKISMNLEGSTGTGSKSEKINGISLSNTREAVSNLVKENMVASAQLPFVISSNISEVKSNEELSYALGMSAKGGFGPFKASVSASLNAENNDKMTYAVLLLRQVYYTIDFDYPTEKGASGFFAENTTIEQVKSTIKTADVPAYVSSMSYGRLVAITIKTNYSMEKVRATLNGSMNIGSYLDTKSDFEMKAESELDGMELNYFVYGGSIEGNQNVLSSISQREMIDSLNAKYDPSKNVGVPISYTLSHLGDGSLAKVGDVSEYYVKNLEPIAVESVHFTSAEAASLKSKCVSGANDIILNATKYGKDGENAALYPLTYKIKHENAETNGSESVLKDSGGNTILSIRNYGKPSDPFGYDTLSREYRLSISDKPEHVGGKYVIVAEAGEGGDKKSSEIEIEILPIPTESVVWDINTVRNLNPVAGDQTTVKYTGIVEPGKTLDLHAYSTPSNATWSRVDYKVTQGSFLCSLVPVNNYYQLVINQNAEDGTVVRIAAEAGGVSSIPIELTVQKAPVDENVEIIVNDFHTVSFIDVSPGVPDFKVENGAELALGDTKYVPQSRDGYIFGGMYLDSGYNTAFIDGYKVTSDLFLYAKWTAITYKINFNANKPATAMGTVENTMHSQSLIYDDEARALYKNEFALNGWKFIGWATSALGSKVYNDQASVRNLTSTKDAVIQLYAVWEKAVVVHNSFAPSLSVFNMVNLAGVSDYDANGEILFITPNVQEIEFVGDYTGTAEKVFQNYNIVIQPRSADLTLTFTNFAFAASTGSSALFYDSNYHSFGKLTVRFGGLNYIKGGDGNNGNTGGNYGRGEKPSNPTAPTAGMRGANAFHLGGLNLQVELNCGSAVEIIGGNGGNGGKGYSFVIDDNTGSSNRWAMDGGVGANGGAGGHGINASGITIGGEGYIATKGGVAGNGGNGGDGQGSHNSGNATGGKGGAGGTGGTGGNGINISSSFVVGSSVTIDAFGGNGGHGGTGGHGGDGTRSGEDDNGGDGGTGGAGGTGGNAISITDSVTVSISNSCTLNSTGGNGGVGGNGGKGGMYDGNNSRIRAGSGGDGGNGGNGGNGKIQGNGGAGGAYGLMGETGGRVANLPVDNRKAGAPGHDGVGADPLVCPNPV